MPAPQLQNAAQHVARRHSYAKPRRLVRIVPITSSFQTHPTCDHWVGLSLAEEQPAGNRCLQERQGLCTKRSEALIQPGIVFALLQRHLWKDLLYPRPGYFGTRSINIGPFLCLRVCWYPLPPPGFRGHLPLVTLWPFSAPRLPLRPFHLNAFTSKYTSLSRTLPQPLHKHLFVRCRSGDSANGKQGHLDPSNLPPSLPGDEASQEPRGQRLVCTYIICTLQGLGERNGTHQRPLLALAGPLGTAVAFGLCCTQGCQQDRPGLLV